MSRFMQWLRRWRQRDDQHLFKLADPIEELREIVALAQESDAVDEHRLYPANVSPDGRRRVARRWWL
jgi:hypothetical protein